MLQSKTYKIKSCDDEELGIKRDSLLEFKLDYDDEKEMKALFFFINGIRATDYASYEAHLAEFIVKEFQVAVIRVEYHCIGHRPHLQASMYMDKKDKENYIYNVKTLEKLAHTSIKLPENLFNDEILDEEECYIKINSLCNILVALKNQNRIPQGRCTISVGLQPTKNEYQNFGVMQALDILNALCFVKNNPPFKLAKDYKSLLFGTSHGGYIAFLASKFAPWLIDAVVENSGYVDVPFRLLGLGKENCFANENNVESASILSENLALCFFTKSHFSLDKNSPNYYSPAFDKIRSMSEHLHTQSKHHKSVYISYHSINDTIALPQKKEKLYERLSNLGFEAKLKMIKDESEVDGKFIKNLTHGMDMSMKMLIQKELPPLLERTFKHSKNEKRKISYLSDDLEYCFEERGGGIKLMIKKRNKGENNV